jgi:putative ABC transport system permease protein
MKIIRYLQVAIESIVAHKLRAILTMLGIIIGVAAVLTTMGIGRGAAANVTERITSQGTNLLTVSPGASSSGSESLSGIIGRPQRIGADPTEGRPAKGGDHLTSGPGCL